MPTKESKKQQVGRERNEMIEREREAIEERNNALKFEFVTSELDLALTFCHIAASTNNSPRSRRNLARAQEAYSAASHFLVSSRLSEPMRRTVQQKVADLESFLRQLRSRIE